MPKTKVCVMALGLDLLVKLAPEARLSKAVPLHFGTSFFFWPLALSTN